MLTFSVWRSLFRIPWMKDNREAIHILSNIYLILLTLYKTRRFKDFYRLMVIFLKMIDSCALHSRKEAKSAIDQLLGIPWFKEKQQDIYRLIVCFKQLMDTLPSLESFYENDNIDPKQKLIISSSVIGFIEGCKILINYNEFEESKVNELINNSEMLDEIILHYFTDLL